MFDRENRKRFRIDMMLGMEFESSNCQTIALVSRLSTSSRDVCFCLFCDFYQTIIIHPIYTILSYSSSFGDCPDDFGIFGFLFFGIFASQLSSNLII